MERGYRALQVMDNHLKTHDWFVAGRFTVADIALYAYTHVAEQCDFDLGLIPVDQAVARSGRGVAGIRSDGLAGGHSRRRRPRAGGSRIKSRRL